MNLKISRILHAGYLFECGSSKVVFDPIFENPFSINNYAYPAVEFEREEIRKLKLDAIFISHYHDDHCSLESLNLLSREIPLYIFCVHEEIFNLIQKLGFKNVYSLKLGEIIQIKDFTIKVHTALDEDVDSIFQIQVAGLNILNVVDSWIGPETFNQLKIQNWDLVLWPFQTMQEMEVLSPSRAEKSKRELPSEWLEQLKEFKPKHVIPSSCQFIQEDWSWYRHFYFPISYQIFRESLQKILPYTEVIRLDPGASLLLTPTSIERTESVPWIKQVGPHDVDYTYDPDLPVPSTSEIAQHFRALSLSETQTLRTYCTQKLLEEYKKIGPSYDLFFNKKRIWQLSLWDHEGKNLNFYYELNDESIRLIPPTTPHWKTELPLTKLYTALTSGESLSSLYLRINDGPFSSETEKDFITTDFMQDPLLRCLYGEIGTYQKAQALKILVDYQ